MNQDLQLLSDWWQLFVARWKRLPIATTSHLLMLATGFWVLGKNLLRLFQ